MNTGVREDEQDVYFQDGAEPHQQGNETNDELICTGLAHENSRGPPDFSKVLFQNLTTISPISTPALKLSGCMPPR